MCFLIWGVKTPILNDLETNDKIYQSMAEVLKIGDSGTQVAELQKLLNQAGADPALMIDGDFGNRTLYAVKQYQRKNKLVADGIVGIRTIAKLYESNAADAWESGFIREPYPLRSGANQFKAERTRKKGITLHYAVEPHNPFRVIDVWNKDSRGAVATHFVIGGKLGNANEHDGKVIQAFSLDYWAYHIAATRTGLPSSWSKDLNESMIGIECCTLGNLERLDNGRFYSESRRVFVPEDEVCILDKPFRTYQYWHKMSDKMLESLEQLCKDLLKKFNILLDGDLHMDASWFDLSWDALRGRRNFTTHTNFEWGKFDLMPQPELIEMLGRLYEWAGKEGLIK